MKKRNFQKRNLKNRFLNKLGMTYVELLCALSLLSLIVVMFTPMLLSSYENLYKAGETVEEVYESKEELEEGLATRFSEKTIVFNSFNLGLNNLQTNADLLFEAINVNGKKVVSSLQQGLETVFGNARASVDIISPRIVYDDQSNHDVMIQTTGIEYSKVFYGSYSAKYGTNQETADAAFLAAHKSNIAAGGKGVIFIEVIIPDKAQNVSSGGTTSEEAVYLSSNLANLQLYKVENLEEKSGTTTTSGSFDMLNTDNYGRIKFNISGRTGTPLDFTQSPVKINVYYVNPREQVKEVSDYLIIDPPTMIFAGDTNSTVDYYTSAGVTEKDGTYSLKLEARKMRTANSGYLSSSDTPGSKGTRIQTITWVQEDENAKLKPYYVMAGTNSSVYRMYNYRVNTTIDDVFGISGTTDTPEGSFILSDGSLANPSFWSGEMSDQFYFRTQEEGMGYGATADNTKDCSSGTRYNYFDKNLKYAMMFNGFTTGYTYAHQANRRISYILTEVGNKSFRLGGKKMGLEDYEGYTKMWEPSGDYVTFVGRSKFLGFYTQFNTEDAQVVYLYNDSGIKDVGAANAHYDRHLGYLRLKSYTSVNPFVSQSSSDYIDCFNKGDFWWPTSSGSESDLSGESPNQDNGWLTSNHGNSPNISASAFLPGSGSDGQGQVIYFGSVPAYAFLRQSSDIGTTDDATKIYNNDKIKASRPTAYVICGSEDVGATIYKGYSSSNNETVAVSNALRDAGYRDVDDNTTNDVPSTDQADLFYTVCIDEVYKYQETDLVFSLGYCSRWRMTMGDVTHNGEVEETKSYEKYYKYSNPSATYTRVPSGGLNTGDTNNIYYNVWFPGEFYNLTQVDTLDEVTVAVGYTVSGSTYMKESAAVGSGYYGTALGSIYNDAVLSAYVSEDAGGKVFQTGLSGKGERNAIFQNLLYYKSPTFTNATLHSRENVRFTAVALISFTDENGAKTYQAIYGDNHGKLYFSTVATSTVSNTSGDEGAAVESNVILKTAANGSALTTADMVELTFDDSNPYAIVGTNSLSTIFSEISSIEANEDFVIVTGPAKDGGVEQFAVFERPDPTQNVWTMKRVYNGTFKGTVNNAMILGDYYYIAGDGWVAAVSLETLRNTPGGGTITNKTESLSASAEVTGTSTNKDHLLWVSTATNIYALDGRLTEG